jgi:hypothetical protein
MGRGCHDGKRVGARTPGLSVCAAASDRKSPGFPRLPPELRKTPVILIRHGQPNSTGCSPSPARIPASGPTFNRSRTPPSTSCGRGFAAFQSRSPHHQSVCARTRNRRDHSRASQRTDHGGAVDCRTLLVHLRYRFTLGRASCQVTGSCIRPSTGPVVAPGGGNGGDDLPSIPRASV